MERKRSLYWVCYTIRIGPLCTMLGQRIYTDARKWEVLRRERHQSLYKCYQCQNNVYQLTVFDLAQLKGEGRDNNSPKHVPLPEKPEGGLNFPFEREPNYLYLVYLSSCWGDKFTGGYNNNNPCANILTTAYTETSEEEYSIVEKVYCINSFSALFFGRCLKSGTLLTTFMIGN